MEREVGSRSGQVTGRHAPRSLLWRCLLALVAPSIVAPGGDAAAGAGCTGEVDGLFAAVDKQDSPGAVVGIFERGKILYAKGYGIANLDHGIPLSPRTVLRTGSISKQFIGMGMALLAEQGRVNAGDDIRKYLPEMRDYGKPITVAHLLHHTSGIREYLTLVSLIGKPEGSGHVYTPEDVLSMLVRQKALEFSPGEKFSYSNSGYFLLAEIVRRATGKSASTFLEQHIFEPLGMEASRLHDDPDAVIRDRGVGYSPRQGGGYRLDLLRLKVVGDLGVATSVDDLFKWDQNFYGNRLGRGSPQLIETVLTPGALDGGERLTYAHGLIVGRYRGLKTVSHGGSEPGYVADYLRFPEQRFSVAVLSNLSSFSPEQVTRKIADLCLADHFTEPPVSPPDEAVPDQPIPTRALSASERAAYAGDYYSDELEVIYRLREHDGGLHLTVNAVSGSVRARGADHLRWSAGGADFLFTRDWSGAIEGFSLQSESVQGLRFRKLDCD